MSDQYIGEIRLFGCNFAPYGWALCAGQIMAITQNTALFSLLGTYYGGNGTSTFALPNLQGNLPTHQGSGAGLNPYVIGETGGSTNVTILNSTMPSHSHTLPASSSVGRINIPSATSALGAVGRGAANPYSPSTSANTNLYPTAVSFQGGNLPHNNMMPTMALNFCIALTGIFPARN